MGTKYCTALRESTARLAVGVVACGGLGEEGEGAVGNGEEEVGTEGVDALAVAGAGDNGGPFDESVCPKRTFARSGR